MTATKQKTKKVKEPKKEETQAQEQRQLQVIERVIENREIAPADVFGTLTRGQIELIKRTVATGASDDELRLFLQVCKGANLNPFLKQVHLIPRWDSRTGTEKRTIQVSIDGFRSIAESSGAYAGNDDPIYEGDAEIEYGKDKKKVAVPEKATVTVYKFLEGQRYPFTATARWSEYYPGDRMGFQWHIRPFLMLGKCAEALALRKAFPKLLSSMYVQEEMDKAMQVDTEAVKQQKGFERVMEAAKQADLAQLLDYKERMLKSDKYTEEEKKEFIAAIESRLAELQAQNEEAKKEE